MRRILVVEDDHLVYEAIHAAFSLKGGFQVSHAADGEAAFSALAAGNPDLALIDYELPKVAGITLARLARTKGIPVIMMSGYIAVLANSDECPFPLLAKPFRVSELVDRFDQLVAVAKHPRRVARQTAGGPASATAATSSHDWLSIGGNI